MIFRKCSIGGKVYHGDEDEMDEDSLEKAALVKSDTSSPPSYPSALGNVDINRGQLVAEIPLAELRSSASTTADQPAKPLDGDPESQADAQDSAKAASITSNPVKAIHHFHDAELSKDLVAAVNEEPDSAGAAHARQLNGFFTVLALCHTVLTNLNPITGKVEYKAQSPDEAALVQAAADMGFVFKGREREVLYLQTPFHGAAVADDADGEKETPGRPSGSGSAHGSNKQEGEGVPGALGHSRLAAQAQEGLLERYELLNILEFTSARKRMSVVLRKLDTEDRRLFLLSKGADNVIFERLKPGSQEELKQTTEEHLDEFASEGLRTLTLAYKVIPGTSSLLYDG